MYNWLDLAKDNGNSRSFVFPAQTEPTIVVPRDNEEEEGVLYFESKLSVCKIENSLCKSVQKYNLKYNKFNLLLFSSY